MLLTSFSVSPKRSIISSRYRKTPAHPSFYEIFPTNTTSSSSFAHTSFADTAPISHQRSNWVHYLCLHTLRGNSNSCKSTSSTHSCSMRCSRGSSRSACSSTVDHEDTLRPHRHTISMPRCSCFPCTSILQSAPPLHCTTVDCRWCAGHDNPIPCIEIWRLFAYWYRHKPRFIETRFPVLSTLFST